LSPKLSQVDFDVLRFNLSWERSRQQIEVREDSRVWTWRVFYSEDGETIYSTKPYRIPRPPDPSGIPGRSSDPRTYHRMYYRKLRRHRDGRKNFKVADDGGEGQGVNT
jgi:hypothetical protein